MDINESELEPMNIDKALKELNISLDEIELTKLDDEYIRKKYHKMALKWHPDKNKDKNAKEKFQKINESYDYLLNELHAIESNNLNKNNSKTKSTFVSLERFKDAKNYINILTNFISSLFKGTYNEVLMTIVNEIILGYEPITAQYLKTMLEQLDKQRLIDLYQMLYKYRDILHISSETLELVYNVVSSIMDDKYKKDRVFILKPTLKDIMEHNIYKLYVDETLYLVPLWHNELYFDSPDGTEIIVLCQPKLPTNIIIDENNYIYYEMMIKIDGELSELIKGSKFVSLELGEKWFTIPLNNLYLKEEQIYRFKNQGIAQIIEKDIYSVSCKGDIIVKIILI